MTAGAAERYRIGEAIFFAQWRPAPDVSEGVDGLGPLYNASSCAGCHSATPSAPPTPKDPPQVRVSRVLRLSVGAGAPEPVYGAQVQDRAIPGHSAEAQLSVALVDELIALGDGRTVTLSRPSPSITAAAYGDLSPDTRLSLRVPPPLAGAGLIGAIADADIRALADPDDRNGDGISGRAGEVHDPAGGEIQLARFGWQATVATLDRQTAEALHLDMGISSPALPAAAGDCTAAQAACRNAAHGGSAAAGGAEISAAEIGLLVAYLDGLAPPASSAAVASDAAVIAQGRGVFAAIGCAACHHVAFTTPEQPATPHLSAKRVALHSDLLLHDMGDGLADRTLQGATLAKQWRTAPLWGLSRRLAEIGSGALPGLLHDGRAASIGPAILWHGGEAAAARQRFLDLDAGNRAALERYLGSL